MHLHEVLQVDRFVPSRYKSHSQALAPNFKAQHYDELRSLLSVSCASEEPTRSSTNTRLKTDLAKPVVAIEIPLPLAKSLSSSHQRSSRIIITTGVVRTSTSPNYGSICSAPIDFRPVYHSHLLLPLPHASR